MEPTSFLVPLGRLASAAVSRVSGRARERRPLEVAEAEEPLNHMRAWNVVTPSRLEQGVAPAVGMLEARQWLVSRYRAVACAEGFATVVFTNRTKQMVRLTALRAEVVERQPPYGGTLVEYDPAGASEVEGVFFDLDSAGKAAQLDAWPADQASAPDYFRVRQVQLRPGEAQTFAVRAGTETDYCQWRIIATAVIRGRERQATGRRTYEVSAAKANIRVLAWQWWEQPPRLGPR